MESDFLLMMLKNDFLTDRLHVLTEEQLKTVFRSVHNVNNLLGEFSKRALNLREVSVNSAIAAGHVSNESRALSEAAKQIGVLSIFLYEAIDEARFLNANISNSILNCIVQTSKHEKFIEALSLILSAEGPAAVLQDIVKKSDYELTQLLCAEKRNLQKLNPLVNRVRQLIRRTGSIVMSLKVSSGIADDNENSFFIPIAESLEAIAEECIQDCESLTQQIEQIDGTLQVACQCARKHRYAE